jgi:hypothetical protein
MGMGDGSSVMGQGVGGWMFGVGDWRLEVEEARRYRRFDSHQLAVPFPFFFFMFHISYFHISKLDQA